MPASPISQIVDQLTSIITAAETAGSRIRYFAALYRRVTITVLAEIDTLQDPARMTRLDVAFAKRYLSALAACQQARRRLSGPRACARRLPNVQIVGGASGVGRI
jgi:hypothetical protein